MKWLGRILAAVGSLAVALALIGSVYFASVVRGGFAAQDQPSALEARMAGAMRSLSVPRHAQALKNPLTPTPAILAGAREHWADHCATCHANDGSGETQRGEHLMGIVKAVDEKGLTLDTKDKKEVEANEIH